jgi:hypothetical protein
MGTNNNVLANGGFGSPWSPGLMMLCLGARLGNQQELASGAARLKEAHRLYGVCEREGSADRNRKLTLARELENRIESAPMYLAHRIDHRDDEAADFERLREEVTAKIDWIRRSAGASV